MFKKVIGQESSDSHKSSLPTPSNQSSSAGYADSSSSAAGSKSATGATRNVLSPDVEIKGTVKFQDDLIVDGKIEGEIQSSGNLTVGENARLKAEINTGTIIVYGKVHGNMTASDRVELKSSAEVIGDIKAKILMIEAGAIFVGKSTVGAPSQVTSVPDTKSTPPAATPSQPGLAMK